MIGCKIFCALRVYSYYVAGTYVHHIVALVHFVFQSREFILCCKFCGRVFFSSSRYYVVHNFCLHMADPFPDIRYSVFVSNYIRARCVGNRLALVCLLPLSA